MFKLLSASLFCAVSVLALGAQANDFSESTVLTAEPEFEAICPDLKLTATQKAELKALKEAHKEKFVERRAVLKNARTALETAFADPNTTEEMIITKQMALKDAVAAIINTRFSMLNQIIFKVLTKEQRLPGVACVKKIRTIKKKEILERKCKGLVPKEDELESGVEE